MTRTLVHPASAAACLTQSCIAACARLDKGQRMCVLAVLRDRGQQPIR
ncbi:MAG: hypothetical protein JSR77_12485 [Planctomycetes bacterium]|nr:hypothetical protein [Planctomycetota bacterium]